MKTKQAYKKKIIYRRFGPVCPPNPYPPIDDPLIMDSFQQNEMNNTKKDDNRIKNEKLVKMIPFIIIWKDQLGGRSYRGRHIGLPLRI